MAGSLVQPTLGAQHENVSIRGDYSDTLLEYSPAIKWRRPSRRKMTIDVFARLVLAADDAFGN
jgi:hypothetical protein